VQGKPAASADLTDRLLAFVTFLMKRGGNDAYRLIGELDLSMSQMRLLFVLDNCEREMALHELAEIVGLSVAATGRAVDSLVGSEMATRREDPEDRRVKRIAIAEAGRRTTDRVVAARRAGMESFVESLDAGERAALDAALEPLLEREDVRRCLPGGSK
jgi:DNA-binding MarR family transcriptional regulator